MFSFLHLAFLYFPEDKSEYIPVVIELVVLVALCVFVFRWLQKKSKKDAEKARILEERIMQAKKDELK
ncbi:hypothetical protein [Psychrobacillus antarcticus]|uniref:hypothetical protein n=1 Tax=Psychrobacillus antarcticus TaxID=2879115 RepID=UPI0024078B58|nr:hypothetical protein [Psychrobacillus antarcticus]